MEMPSKALHSKNDTLTQRRFNVSPSSAALAQHCINVVSMCCVYTVILLFYAKANSSNVGPPSTTLDQC